MSTIARTRLMPAIMKDARIMFRNFAGEAKQFNEAGQRNFCVFLSEETAERMAIEGWNVKRLKPRDDDPLGQPFLKVKVKFGNRPPKLVLVSSRGKTTLTEDEAILCDWVEIANVDLTINPSFWDVNGKSGVTAYLKSIWITVVEDELDLKYAEVPEIERGNAPLQITDGRPDDDEIVIEDDDNPPWDD